jgi:hypothetical protein
MTTTISEQVQTPLESKRAFAYIADFGHQAEWDPNTTSSRRVDSGELGTGARFALEVRSGWSTKPMEYRITEYEPPTRVVLVGEGPGIWSRDTITLTPMPSGGTLVDYVAEIRLDGILGWLQPLLGRPLASVGTAAATGLERELDRIAAAGS